MKAATIGGAGLAMTLLAMGAAAAPGREDELYSSLLNYWWGERYSHAVHAGIAHRDRFGRTLKVDYMIGTGACRVREYRDRGWRLLRTVQRDFGGTMNARDLRLVGIEIGKCTPAWGQSVVTYYREHPASDHWIGIRGAYWDPSFAGAVVDPEGEDLAAILSDSMFEQASADSILQEMRDLPGPDAVEVAPCGGFCGEWESAPAAAGDSRERRR